MSNRLWPVDLEIPMAEREDFMRLTTEIVSAHVANNKVPTDQLPALIQRVFNALATVEQVTSVPPKPESAVPVNRSVRSDHIVCLECGKHFSMLKRHLMTDHKMTPQQYRQRWELPISYPLVAPDYAKVRSTLAKKIGLGRKGPAARKSGRKLARKARARG
jgi:predicted transcriptional regulator